VVAEEEEEAEWGVETAEVEVAVVPAAAAIVRSVRRPPLDAMLDDFVNAHNVLFAKFARNRPRIAKDAAWLTKQRSSSEGVQ
jgi:hypothetical protein